MSDTQVAHHLFHNSVIAPNGDWWIMSADCGKKCTIWKSPEGEDIQMFVLFRISGTVYAFGNDYCVHHSGRAYVSKARSHNVRSGFIQEGIVYRVKNKVTYSGDFTSVTAYTPWQHVSVFLFRCLNLCVWVFFFFGFFFNVLVLWVRLFLSLRQLEGMQHPGALLFSLMWVNLDTVTSNTGTS